MYYHICAGEQTRDIFIYFHLFSLALPLSYMASLKVEKYFTKKCEISKITAALC